MRLKAPLHLTIAVCLALSQSGCKNTGHTEDASNGMCVIAVAAFKIKDPEKSPNQAELAALKAYTFGLYNPTPKFVDAQALGNSGFQILVSSVPKIDRSLDSQVLFSQNLNSVEGNAKLQVGRMKGEKVGSFHATVSAGDSLVPSENNLVGDEDIGTHEFDNGVIVVWVSMPVSK